MKKLTAELSQRSLQKLADDLMEYARRLETAEEEIVQRMSTEAAAEAGKYFSEGVSVFPNGHGITANGESVVFEEFGAGATVRDLFPGGADVSFEIRRGAYSELHHGEYEQTGYEYWHHHGQRLTHVDAGNGLFYGMEAARSSAPEIVKEVLEKL